MSRIESVEGGSWMATRDKGPVVDPSAYKSMSGEFRSKNWDTDLYLEDELLLELVGDGICIFVRAIVVEATGLFVGDKNLLDEAEYEFRWVSSGRFAHPEDGREDGRKEWSGKFCIVHRIKTGSEETKHYYYSWEDNFSTDPEWDYSKPYSIWLNGIEQKRVLCCLTGSNGFVKKVKTDSEDRAVTWSEGLLKEIFVGKVEVKVKVRKQ